jgi:hypothetical protein
VVVRILVILADVFLLVTPPAQRDRRTSAITISLSFV